MKIDHISTPIINSATIKTPLGDMIAIADNAYLYALFFEDQSNKNKIIATIENRIHGSITIGTNPIISLITQELHSYFEGNLEKFTVPISMLGTDFQCKTRRALLSIPFGQTWSYVYQAESMSCNKSQRAVGAANGSNPLSIIVPCHRVIRFNGTLGGYAGGLWRKQWLLNHEKNHRFHQLS